MDAEDFVRTGSPLSQFSWVVHFLENFLARRIVKTSALRIRASHIVKTSALRICASQILIHMGFLVLSNRVFIFFLSFLFSFLLSMWELAHHSLYVYFVWDGSIHFFPTAIFAAGGGAIFLLYSHIPFWYEELKRGNNVLSSWNLWVNWYIGVENKTFVLHRVSY